MRCIHCDCTQPGRFTDDGGKPSKYTLKQTGSISLLSSRLSAHDLCHGQQRHSMQELLPRRCRADLVHQFLLLVAARSAEYCGASRLQLLRGCCEHGSEGGKCGTVGPRSRQRELRGNDARCR